MHHGANQMCIPGRQPPGEGGPLAGPGVHPRPGRRAAGACRARGTVLIVTMWILLVLAGLVIVLARAVRVEGDCSANQAAALQAGAVQEGAIQYVLANVDALDGQVPEDADVPCEAVRVGDGLFWILRPDTEDDQTYAFGITDEMSKVNLNTASQDMLAMLRDMTEELAASIVDWRDADSDVTAGGAESEYYLLLADPYECKNGPFETVDELLLVRGATPEILYGQDANRNGILDPGEDTALVTASSGSGSRLDRGIAGFVTLYGTKVEPTSGGVALVNVNDPQQSGALTDLLREAVGQDRLPGILDRAFRGRPFQSILDFYLRTGLTSSEFQQVANKITTTAEGQQVALINVNTAPREVLLCLPGLEDADVSALLSARATSGTDRTNVAWVAEVLSPAKAEAIGGFITTQSYFFWADIVSLAGNGRAFRRCRVVVDARQSPPRVVYRQDLTHLGWPLSPDILTSLRSGTSVDEIAQTSNRGIIQQW